MTVRTAESIDFIAFVLNQQAVPVDELAVIGSHFIVVELVIIRYHLYVITVHTEVLIRRIDQTPISRFVGSGCNSCDRSTISGHEQGVTLLSELRQQIILDITLRMDEGGADIRGSA